ncbi:TIGR03016 family PEP-CTERM system-associated outer membrane protein [Massilia sp. CCM 8695]|uniref:TIGR03016 family PEP-CTERM system-associated outer membrane protein n=2 Tax=Massilia frigida TaxID=2609281 RepID=A0ABX0MY81_9BURK|nr:TIGR03016 family PEP-CTERM system-associated outer membrane protein [Massilia frigida]
MTTTMAKRASGRRRAVVVPAALAALLAAPSSRAEWKFTPTVDLRETYTDNVALTRADEAKSRFVTELTPGFSLLNKGPRLNLFANYKLHYYAFDDNDVEGVRHAQSQLRAAAKATVIGDLLFLDADGAIGQQAVSAFGPQVNSNGYASANRANVKTWRISPYLLHRFGSSATAAVRYTHDSVDAGRIGFGDSSSEVLTMNLNSGRTFRRVGWGVQYSGQRVDDSIAPKSNVKMVSANARYRLGQEFNLTASAGYDEYDYQSGGEPTKGRFWQGGIEWTPTSRTSLVAGGGKRYYGNTYNLRALHRSRRTVWSINYSDSVTTTRSQLLLPATIDTASMLDRLFTAQIPDPAKRAQAVDAYIRSTGLPSALADSINYFSNRYILQKQFQASVALNTARTTLILSAFDNRREGLSLIQTDSLLTGPASARINDDTTQRGGSALWNMRLTSRSGINASWTSSRTQSHATGLSSKNAALRLAVTRQFSPKVRGAFEARRVSGTTTDQVASYRENALTASLSLQF